MKNTAQAAAAFGVKLVNGFTGSPIWHLLYSLPAEQPPIRSRPATRNSPTAGTRSWTCSTRPACASRLEVHPTEIAYDIPTTEKTLAAIGDRPAFGIQLRPEPPVSAVRRPGGVHRDLRRPDLPRACQGQPAQSERPHQHSWLAPELRRPAPRLGFRLARPRRHRRGGRSSAR